MVWNNSAGYNDSNYQKQAKQRGRVANYFIQLYTLYKAHLFLSISHNLISSPSLFSLVKKENKCLSSMAIPAASLLPVVLLIILPLLGLAPSFISSSPVQDPDQVVQQVNEYVFHLFILINFMTKRVSSINYPRLVSLIFESLRKQNWNILILCGLIII